MDITKNNSFEIEIDIEKISQAWCLDDIFYLQDLQQRKIYLNDDINSFVISPIARTILQYNSDDRSIPVAERKPIFLYISSNGGDVDAGFELIDVILSSKTPVYTINLGHQYSMGFLIGLAGKKRYASRNAKFLMHDGANFIYDSGSKAQDRMEFNKRIDARIKDFVLSRSKLSEEEYDSKLRVEWYTFASEAKEKGFVDYIIGTDVELDEII